ncbi:MAG: ETC complex I subunit [Cohaesibacter sp.]|nr:ETC complex I subunit [Cohaesibacter sp.]
MKARIFRPSKNAMQSGLAKIHRWVLEFEQTSSRSLEPLMGYTSSRDTRQQLNLSFDSKDEAIAYAKRNKIDYQLIEPKERKRRIVSYSENFATNRVEGNWTH